MTAAEAGPRDPGPENSREIYFSLFDKDPRPQLTAARAYLEEKLAQASVLPSDLPLSMEQLPQWIERGAAQAGQRYRTYLEGRRAGRPRQYFSNKSHALHFLNAVAPTKLVDGSWLYGMLQRWHDQRFAALIRTYLEELGDGLPDKNHVVLYRSLLAAHGCEHWQHLSDDHYTQGAIQLSLAHHAAEFMPEVIGFNLGYEQLPLHLLITAYELNELGIDPYYFTLHVTVDNAASGHARKAMQAVFDALPGAEDREDFFRRVSNGYRLNMLGVDTLGAIASFDLEQAVVAMLAAKAPAGAALHSDYCRVGGRPVSDWLSEPQSMDRFLAALEQAGWIKRHRDPEESRFWKLIRGDKAEMFGVFTAYEQQLLHDWIAGDALKGKDMPRQPSFRARRRMDGTPDAGKTAYPPRGLLRTHPAHRRASSAPDGFQSDLRALEDELAALPDRDSMMARLIELLSPASHHTAAGMMATRIFSRMFGE